MNTFIYTHLYTRNNSNFPRENKIDTKQNNSKFKNKSKMQPDSTPRINFVPIRR